MTSTVFVNQSTVIVADWLNDVNATTYTTVPSLAIDVAGKAESGANSDITSITGLITPLSVLQGGTGAATLNALAKSGANTDITSLGAVTGVTATAGDSSTKLATTAFVMGAGGGYKQIQPITASVAASALTCTLNPLSLDFRATPLTSGTVNTRTVGTVISLVVPSTATLGTVNAIQSRLVLLAIDNAGTVELAVVNIAGGNNLDETTLINTVAVDTASDSANVIYSTTARTGVPYRVVGYVESTQATAGTWATAPSTIQGAGGQSAIPVAMNASGIAPMFACRAWVNFNGTGTVAIRASGNVSSITDNGVGDYTVNFTTAMQDTNYCFQALSLATASLIWDTNLTYATTSLRYRLVNTSGAVGSDSAFQNVAIFR